MAQPIRSFDTQSWSPRPHSTDSRTASRTARRDVQLVGNPAAGIMSAVLHLLVEHICQEPQDAKRLFRYIKRKLKKYLEYGDQQLHPNFDKPQTILLKNELNRVISETASQARIAIHHDRIFRTEIGLITNPSAMNSAKYYVPDIRESHNYCENNFTFIAEIGRGGFGAVYRMRNKVDNVEYAIKKIELEDMTVEGNKDAVANNEKIRKEVLILAKLDHPNVVRYHSTWTQHRVVVRSTCCRVPDLQRNLSWQPTPCLHSQATSCCLKNGCGDGQAHSGELVIEELRGASGGPNRGQLMLPVLEKGAQLTSQDFARASNQRMWSSEWSDGVDNDEGEEEEQEEEEKKEEKQREGAVGIERKRMPSGEIKNCGSCGKSPMDSGVMELVRHGRFNGSASTTTSLSILRSLSLEPKSTPYPVLQTTLYIQMQLCDLSLKDWLYDRAASGSKIVVDRDQCMQIFEQAVRGVAYLHSRHIIHRDIKPANILLVRRSDSGELLVKLADFGLSRYVPTVEEQSSEASPASEMSSKIGTLFYAAPEQRSGCQYGREADMYSLGLILFELFRPCGSDSELVSVTEGLRWDPIHCPHDFLAAFPDVATLVCQLVQRDPQKRLTAHDLLREGSIMGKEWMRKHILDLSHQVSELTADLKLKNDRISFLEGLLRSRSV